MVLQHDPEVPGSDGGDPVFRPWPYHAWIVAGVALAVGAGAYAYYANAMVHRWYSAAFILDFGWFNDLVSGRTLALQNPRGINSLSFHSTHVSPILSIFAGLSRLLRLSGPQPIVMTLSVGFGGAAAMAFVVLERFLRPAGMIAALAGGALGAAVYAISGVMRATADYPHIEILYVPLALLTLHLLFQRKFRWAWAAFVFCLLEREDAGLHLGCILGAYLVLAAIDERGVPTRLRELAPFVAVCLIYPMLAVAWQQTLSESTSTFQAIYAGSPPYRHVTGALMAERFGVLAGAGSWVSLTIVAALCVAPFQRRWTALTGLAAAMPWFLLNLSAHSSAAGQFRLYYAFPFLVTALAPFVVMAAAPPPPREDPLDVVAL